MLVVGRRVLHEISSFHSLFPLLLFNDNYLQVLAEEMHRYSPPRALFVRQPNFARLALARRHFILSRFAPHSANFL